MFQFLSFSPSLYTQKKKLKKKDVNHCTKLFFESTIALRRVFLTRLVLHNFELHTLSLSSNPKTQPHRCLHFCKLNPIHGTCMNNNLIHSYHFFSIFCLFLFEFSWIGIVSYFAAWIDSFLLVYLIVKFWYIEIRVMIFDVADECVMDSIEGQGLSFAEQNFGVLLESASLVEFESVIHSWGFCFLIITLLFGFLIWCVMNEIWIYLW